MKALAARVAARKTGQERKASEKAAKVVSGGPSGSISDDVASDDGSDEAAAAGVAGAAAVARRRAKNAHTVKGRGISQRSRVAVNGANPRNHSRPRARTLMGSSQQVAAARFLNGAAATSESGGACVSRVDEFWRP